MATSAQTLADLLTDVQRRVSDMETSGQIVNSTIEVDDQTVALVEAADNATTAAEAIPGLADDLDLTRDVVAAAMAAVDEALAAADDAREAGLAAADEANAAAADALARADEAKAAADEALANAGGAGGGNVYSAQPPTATDKDYGDGTLWFVRANDDADVTQVWLFSRPDPATDGTWQQQTLTDAVLGNVDAGKIGTGFLSAERIEAATLTAAKLAADTLTSREIAADAITAAELAANAVIARNIKAGEIVAGHLAAATITGDKIAAGAIAAGNIAAKAITADKIAAGAITADKLAATAIDGLTITGATIRTAARGKRAIMGGTRIDFYSQDTVYDTDGSVIVDGYAGRIEAATNGGVSNGGVVYVGSGDGLGMTFGKAYLPYAGTVGASAQSAYINELYVDHLYAAQTNSPVSGGDTGWRNIPSFSTNFEADSSRGAQYRKIGNIVYFRGQVNRKSGNITASDGTMFTMPTNYRPPQVWYAPIPSAGNAGAVMRFRALDTGPVGCSAITGTAAYVQLDGFFYPLD